MKVAVLLLGILPAAVCAQVPADLRSAMQARAAAAASVDVATWDRLTADNFTLVRGDGQAMTKVERLAALKTQQPAPQPPRENESVETYGNVAVHRYKAPGGWLQFVWVKHRGAWRVASAQVTPVMSDSTMTAAITAAGEQYRQGWLQGDTGKVLSLLSDDIRFMIQGVPDVKGRAAATTVIAGEIAAYKVPSLTINRDQLVVRTDHAIEIGTYEETLVPTTGTAPTIHAAGRYISIWRREGPGWRLVVSMLNSPTKEFQ
jgi:ketosteroid isomerase-like protein